MYAWFCIQSYACGFCVGILDIQSSLSNLLQQICYCEVVLQNHLVAHEAATSSIKAKIAIIAREYNTLTLLAQCRLTGLAALMLIEPVSYGESGRKD
jgi:hypothetical protein